MSREVQFESVLSSFRALSNDRALRVVQALAQGSATVAEVATRCDLPAPVVEAMLARLSEVELVAVVGQRGAYRYQLRADRLADLPRQLAHMAEPDPSVPLAAPTPVDFEAKTLRDYVVDGRLKTVPSQEKKRLVVLRWLANRFAPDRQYAEREVNAILQDVHPDASSLRRYLVDYKFMARDHGVYWRLPDPV